jgi:hypothetical protein
MWCFHKDLKRFGPLTRYICFNRVLSDAQSLAKGFCAGFQSIENLKVELPVNFKALVYRRNQIYLVQVLIKQNLVSILNIHLDQDSLFRPQTPLNTSFAELSWTEFNCFGLSRIETLSIAMTFLLH